MAHYRILHIDGKKYKYVIGKSYLVIWYPNGQKERLRVDLFGFEVNKKMDKYVITPRMIRDYIVTGQRKDDKHDYNL